MTILKSEKIGFKIKGITRYKERYFIMMKGTIYQENNDYKLI